MGYYINPTGCTKEQWLAEHGTRIDTPKSVAQFAPDRLPVIWVDNGAFTAAGIAYDDHDLARFTVPDPRPKLWVAVERADLYTVSDLGVIWPADRDTPYTEEELDEMERKRIDLRLSGG